MWRGPLMSALARRGLIVTAIGCLPCSAPSLSAQTDRFMTTARTLLDRRLNSTYEQLLSRLTPAGRDQLRKVERAWLAFAELDKIAMREAAARLGLSNADAQDFENGEVAARIGQLDELFDSSGSPELTAIFRQNDAQLNVVYQRCISALSPAEVSALRKAQRAWLVFRDESRKFGGLVGARITAARTGHLNAFYIRSAVSSAPSSEEPVAQQKADPTTPDPFERAR
jgi:uncharacterized protein YecT (DUF1311 family)